MAALPETPRARSAGWRRSRAQLRTLAFRRHTRMVTPWVAGGVACKQVLELVDDASPKWLLRLLLAASTGLVVGLLVRLAIGEPTKPVNNDQLAEVVVDRAQALHDDHRHQAVVDFRASASVVLQLLEEWDCRAQLGEIALRSAQALGNRLAQASIFVDDLGWSTFKVGDVDRALINIANGIDLLTKMLDDPKTQPDERDRVLDLRAKARRHLVAVLVRQRDFDDARSVLEVARASARQLSRPLEVIALAKLDYAEAHVLDGELGASLGAEGRVAANSPDARQLQEIVARCRAAADVFTDHANLEWEAHVADLLPRLLRRYAPDWEIKEAEARAAAIERQRAHHRTTLSP
jgi:hypothetical protein